MIKLAILTDEARGPLRRLLQRSVGEIMQWEWRE